MGAVQGEKRLDLIVGYACNNNCRHCMVSERRRLGDRTTAECNEQMRLGREGGARWIQITGGEPTIRPDVVELVGYARELGFSPVQMLTNARMFRYRDLARSAARAGLALAAPAVHGPDARSHDRVTRSRGSFDQTVDGIRNLRDEGVFVMARTVVTGLNYTSLPEIARLLIGLGVGQYEFTYVRLMGNARDDLEAMAPRLSAVAPYVREAVDIGHESGVPALVEGFPLCLMGGRERAVSELYTTDSEVRDLGMVIESFPAVKRERYKARGEGCARCRYRLVCDGVWREYAELFGTGELSPVLGPVVTGAGRPPGAPPC